jgi:hypothetical protein
MRKVNFAQRCANVFASVRTSAIVVSNLVRQLHLLLLHSLLGTSSKSPGKERPEIYSWAREWMDFKGPMMVPAKSASFIRSTSKHGS